MDAKEARRRRHARRARRFRLLHRFALPVLLPLLRLWARTLRFRGDVEMTTRVFREEKGVIIANLHGEAQVQLAFMYRVREQAQNASVTMASPSRDGQLFAAQIHGFGQKTVTGSSSKGGSAALRALVREVRAGYVGNIAVDGPKGPRAVPQRGIFTLARLLRGRLYVLMATADWCIRLPSWDRHELPLPFSPVRMRLVLFHDYSQGEFAGDEAAALQQIFLEHLKARGEDISQIRLVESPMDTR